MVIFLFLCWCGGRAVVYHEIIYGFWGGMTVRGYTEVVDRRIILSSSLYVVILMLGSGVMCYYYIAGWLARRSQIGRECIFCINMKKLVLVTVDKI